MVYPKELERTWRSPETKFRYCSSFCLPLSSLSLHSAELGCKKHDWHLLVVLPLLGLNLYTHILVIYTYSCQEKYRGQRVVQLIGRLWDDGFGNCADLISHKMNLHGGSVSVRATFLRLNAGTLKRGQRCCWRSAE